MKRIGLAEVNNSSACLNDNKGYTVVDNNSVTVGVYTVNTLGKVLEVLVSLQVHDRRERIFK